MKGEWKYFIKNNRILLIGLLVAVVIIVAYFLTMDIPEWWNGAGELFELFYDVAVGYILSYIFYVLQVYIPTNKNRKKAFQCIKKEVGVLSYDLLDVVMSVECITKIQADRIEILQKEFYFKRVKDESESNNHGGWSNRIELSEAFLEKMKEGINKRINKIINNSFYSQNDDEIIEIISNLQVNHFFDALIATCVCNEQGSDVTAANVEQDFQNLRKDAWTLWNITHSHKEKVVELNSKEKETYMERMKDAPAIKGKARVWVNCEE